MLENPTIGDSLAANRRREQTMFRHMDDVLSRLGPGDKVVLLGHNSHLARSYEDLGAGPLQGPGNQYWPSVGAHLTRRYANEVLAVWMMYDHGENSRYGTPEPSSRVASKPDTVEHSLASAGDLFVLPAAAHSQDRSYIARATSCKTATTARARWRTSST